MAFSESSGYWVKNKGQEKGREGETAKQCGLSEICPEQGAEEGVVGKMFDDRGRRKKTPVRNQNKGLKYPC